MARQKPGKAGDRRALHKSGFCAFVAWEDCYYRRKYEADVLKSITPL